MTVFPVVGETFGRWRITGVLGRGAMGVVFAAVDPSSGRPVALKVLARDLASDEEFRSRFVREAQRLALLDSPHVLRVVEHGEVAGCLYLCTPLIAGGDLRARLEQEGPLPLTEALSVVAQVASALADAHEAGVLHRDVKPGNVLLWRKVDGDHFALLGDFGIARILGDETTRPPVGADTPPLRALGTLGYLAPERHLGEPATVASDVYALGCLLVAALTGRPPYVGTDSQVAEAHLLAPVPVLPGRGRAMRAVNQVIRQSMAKDAHDRYPSAADMRRALVSAEALARTEAAPRSPEATRGRRVAAVLGVGAASVVAVVAVVLAGDSLLPDDEVAPGSSDAPTGLPSAGGGGQDVRCWDASRQADASTCEHPSGLRGLQWAYPSFERAFDDCRENRDPVAERKVRAWFCPFANNPVEGVRYNEWRSVTAARTVISRDYRPYARETVEPAPGVPLHRWARLSPDEHGYITTSIAYAGWPLSLDVQSRTRRGVAAGCRLASLRAPTTFEEMLAPC